MKVEFTTGKKDKKRVGRGISAGQGKTAGRGTKGQKSRTGKKIKIGFEGGQNPLKHRIPKVRGFKSLSKITTSVINVEALNIFKDNEKVTPEMLISKKIIRKADVVKILADGEITKKVSVSGFVLSKKAEDKIKKAGGEILND
ncbi:50S ribosomal protein L15 [bacterium]|nr:50S ribosomal protein L15 [bacterium]